LGLVDMSVNLGGLQMQNPVAVASGTFGYGREYQPYMDISKIGAVIVKGTTLEPRCGNPPPRIYETPAGMLNAIGLENPGIEVFLQEYLPSLMEEGVTVVANLAGNSVDEYALITRIIDNHQFYAVSGKFFGNILGQLFGIGRVLQDLGTLHILITVPPGS
jgi:dihydroorotate dehydrogenase (NAD+) catalytic subunit